MGGIGNICYRGRVYFRLNAYVIQFERNLPFVEDYNHNTRECIYRQTGPILTKKKQKQTEQNTPPHAVQQIQTYKPE